MGLDRRAFLKFATGAGAGILATPVVWKMLDDVSIWSQNWSWIPKNPKGVNTYELTTSKLCPSACGLKVRLVAGNPVRAVSNPEHPFGGGISALAAAEVQLMYSPARVKAPLQRKSDGAFVRITWDEAEALLAAKLKEAGSSLACVSGDETGSSMDVLSAFMKARGAADMYMMPSEAQAASRAWQLMGGNGQIGYDFENSDFVLAIGANVLESWGTFIANRKVFATKRPHGEAPQAAFVYAGPVQAGGAAVADQWIGLKPGTETVFALGLANLLVQQGRAINAPDFAAFKEMIKEFTPQKVASLTGVPAKTLENVVKKLMQASSPLVVAGSEFNQGGGATPIMAGVAVNLLLGGKNIKNVPLGNTALKGAENRNTLFAKDLVAYIASGPKAKVMLFYEANPVYALPSPQKVKEAIKAVPFKVSFSAFLDETSAMCDLVLPMPLGLERLDDIESPYGCGKSYYTLSRKTMAPVVDAKHGMEVLLAASAKIGSMLAPSWQEVLNTKAAGLGTTFANLSNGAVYMAEAQSIGQVKLLPDTIYKAVDRKTAGAAVSLAPMQKIAMGTAQTGIPPFNVKTIRGKELIGSDMCVVMNGATASSRGFVNGDRVKISAAGNDIFARTLIYEGIAPDTVAVYLGFGHTALDAFSQNKGANAAELFTAIPEEGTGLTVWNQTGVSIVKA